MHKFPIRSSKLRTLILISFFIFLNRTPVQSQTWVTATYWDNSGGSTVNYVPQAVGPLEMCKTTGGQIHSIVRIDPDETNYLYNVSIQGSLSGGQISHSGGIYTESAGNLLATSDSGKVYTTQRIGTGYATIKLFKSGNRGNWTKTHTAFPYPNYIQPSVFGKCFILYDDSLVEVDANGNYLRSKFPFSGRIHALNDSDFIVFRGSTISREDFNGNILWTSNVSNFSSISIDTNFIYGRTNGVVFKLKTSDGSLIWQKNISFTSISITHDDGLISCGGIQQDQITRYDSSGNVVWTRNIPFSAFGYRCIIEAQPNFYITGGAYLCKSVWSTGNGYSHFLLAIDSTGHGVVDSTDHFYYGNANDNNILSFADDGAYVAAAMGNSGSARPLIFHRPNSSTVFLKNWPGQFPAGYNYKYSDYDGNGIIDTNDISALSINLYHTVVPHWRISSGQNSLPLLKLLYSVDTVLIGDSIDMYVIAGYDSIPVDSIYSFSMTFLDQYFFDLATSIINIPTNDFGINGINRYHFLSQSPAIVNFLISKTDHINTVLSHDTLVSLRMRVRNTAMEGYWALPLMYNAVTKDGYKVNFRFESDSIYISNPVTNISNTKFFNFNVHPNPVDEFLNISLPELTSELIIFNSVGKEIYKKSMNDTSISIETSGFPDGLYYLKSTSEERVFTSKILIVH